MRLLPSPRVPKRVFDLALSIAALVLLWPLMMVVALLVVIDFGLPVLFRQVRPGLYAKPFTLYKFRSMTDARDSQGELLSDAKRLTHLGRFLRSTSLDELPELVNVLKGDMSLVGPRPLLMRYLPYYTSEERIRFDVRPGVTGWAQVNGRNDLPWDERLQMDVWYVENQSLSLDLKIIWKTLGQVVQRKHIQVDPSSAMLDLDQERGSSG